MSARAATPVRPLVAPPAARLAAVPWRDYVALTKPRIMSLLLLTAAAGMFAGAHGVPDLGRLAALLAGGALASGGASALNHLLDRDVDALMGERTSGRPVAAGRVAPRRALAFGLALSALAFALLASAVNLLAALLASVGTLGYVLVYTRWLKRSTPQNIVIGGAAGAMPPLVGWAAARGGLTAPALLFGCALACLSLLELSLTVNPLAAVLSFSGFLGYVLVYTVWLKRRTPQNIVIGGAAGAVPPLVGWAAVTGSVSGTAVILFFIVF
ncbi:MAG TPA: UbiA family prenyltransferase, partial [Conexibacter sp.]|nr:UbiA family prenyltransferase [Conexibacter sp.]